MELQAKCPREDHRDKVNSAACGRNVSETLMNKGCPHWGGAEEQLELSDLGQFSAPCDCDLAAGVGVGITSSMILIS